MEEQATNHVCGVCGDEWLTEAEYNSHNCPKTNATPQNITHLVNSTTPEFTAIAEAALQRGIETAQANGDEQQVGRNQEAIQQLTTDTPQ